MDPMMIPVKLNVLTTLTVLIQATNAQIKVNLFPETTSNANTVDLSAFGYYYTWPSEEGFFVAPSYSGTGQSSYTNFPNVDSFSDCARKCLKISASGGSYGHTNSPQTCFCEKVIECLEPLIIEKGATIFSVAPKPRECDHSYCDYFAEEEEEYCTDPNVKRKTIPPTHYPILTPTIAPTSRHTVSPTFHSTFHGASRDFSLTIDRTNDTIKSNDNMGENDREGVRATPPPAFQKSSSIISSSKSSTVIVGTILGAFFAGFLVTCGIHLLMHHRQSKKNQRSLLLYDLNKKSRDNKDQAEFSMYPGIADLKCPTDKEQDPPRISPEQSVSVVDSNNRSKNIDSKGNTLNNNKKGGRRKWGKNSFSSLEVFVPQIFDDCSVGTSVCSPMADII